MFVLDDLGIAGLIYCFIYLFSMLQQLVFDVMLSE